jgi:hypothetical protein
MASRQMQKGAPKRALFTIQMERARRFERPTLTLARLCSTPELRPHRLDKGWIKPLTRRPQEEKRIHLTVL